MADQTITADQQNRGWVLIQENNVTVIAIWTFDVVSVAVGPEDGATQISMRNAAGLWHKTSVPVPDVFRAISVASTLYETSSLRKSA